MGKCILKVANHVQKERTESITILGDGVAFGVIENEVVLWLCDEGLCILAFDRKFAECCFLLSFFCSHLSCFSLFFSLCFSFICSFSLVPFFFGLAHIHLVNYIVQHVASKRDGCSFDVDASAVILAKRPA